MKRLILCLALPALLAACGQDSPEPESASEAPVAQISETSPALTDQLLSRIDSEPMMLWLSLEPLPRALLDQLWARMEMVSDLNQETYDDVSEDLEDPLARALIREFGALDSEQAWTERGIEIAGVAGMHTVGPFPFLHWQLSDEAAFTAMLARIEAEAETEFSRRAVGDQSIIWHKLGEVGLAIHHDADFLTAALVADRPELLRRVANIDQAETPLQPAQVNAFNTARGFRNDSAGYIDFQRLIELLFDSDDEMLVAARTEGPLASMVSDQACKTEMQALTQVFPRQSFGTTAASESSMTILTRLETAPDFGLKLAALADTPMSLDIDRGGLLSTAMTL
ncbi:MAG TPA: hypothetical protein VKO38_04255, partial [Wenzhouxiangella sp.]|nr:hypothetical protein [Wenzhouxiangella sp.]